MSSIVVQTSKMNIHRRFSMKKDNSNIKVILFDLDGTLLDSRDFLVQTSFDILQKNYPNQFPYEHIEADFGNGFARLLPNKQSEIGKRSEERRVGKEGECELWQADEEEQQLDRGDRGM